MDLDLPADQSFSTVQQINELQRIVNLGKKREAKKKMLNNYLESVHSEFDSHRSSVMSVGAGERRQSAKQIIIEDASSMSLVTSSMSSSDKEEESKRREGLEEFQIMEADKKRVKEVYQAIPDQAVIVGLTSSIDDQVME